MTDLQDFLSEQLKDAEYKEEYDAHSGDTAALDNEQDTPLTPSDDDIRFMRLALEEARLAGERDEVPIGAVIVRGGEVIATAGNERECSRCATHHAELLAIERACHALGGWRIPGATLYVTLEPCAMCAGAIINSRIDRVVFGAYDTRFGALGSLVNLNTLGFNHSFELLGGVLMDESRALLSDFFKKKRKKNC